MHITPSNISAVHSVRCVWSLDGKLRSTPTFDHAYCQSEYFRVRCGVGEVLIIAHARYGRMRISRCVREHFGYVDCSVDVIDVLDRHCSGRRSCSIRVLDDNFNNVRPCHDDLKSYLEVQHHCLKGTTSSLLTLSGNWTQKLGAAGPRIWNSLPCGLRTLDIGYKHFKTLLKT